MKQLIVASEGMGIWCRDFFTYVAKLEFDSVIFDNSERSHIILRSFFFNHERQFPKNLPYVTWSGEPFEVPERPYPPIFSIWKPSDINAFKIPFIVIAFFELENLLNLKFNLEDLRLIKNNPRPYFLGYCASASYDHRERMFSLLKERDKTNTCHGLGKCQNTIGYTLEGTWHDAWKYYTNYRFVLAMENRKNPHYVTEKILNVLISGAIPIYYGDSTWVKQVFNPKCIIFVDDFPTLEECADFILQVDTNEYENIPRFVKAKHWFQGENENYRKMATMLKEIVYEK